MVSKNHSCGRYQNMDVQVYTMGAQHNKSLECVVVEQHVYALKFYKPVITLGSLQMAASCIAEIYISE